MDARPLLSFFAKATLALALVATAFSPPARAATPTAHDFTLGQSSLKLAAVPAYNQAPVRIAISPALAEFDVTQLSATDNASWLDVAIDRSTRELVLTFRTASLVSASNSATVTVTNSTVSRSLQITAAAAPLSLATLLDDPTRSRMYGVQQNGEATGAVVVFDPLTATPVASISVGNHPADLAINPDGTELAVICSAAPAAIWIIDLATLSVRETIPLSVFNTTHEGDPTSAHVAFGPPGILYYVDSGWGPLLRVLRRSDRTVLQSAGIDGPVAQDTVTNAVYGFGDVAVSPDFTSLYGWAQYGTGAGWAGSYGARFTIAADGRLTFAEKGSVSYPTIMERDPLDTPVLVAADGASVFIKQFAFAGTDLTAPSSTFSGPIYSISRGAEVVATRAAILERATGASLHTFTPGGTVQAITDDYARLVYFDASARQLRTLNLLQSVGPAILGREPSPAEGAFVLPPSYLIWSPLPGVSSYRVYLGTSSTAVSAATPASPLYRGVVNTSTFSVNPALTPGTTYYWRIDAVNGSEITKGELHSFTVASLATSTAQINTTTVRGHVGHIVEIGLSAESVQTWTATSPASWIRFETSTGTTPATLRAILDASALPVGLQRSSITLTAGGSPVTLPVSLQVEPLAVTRFAPRPGSTKVYALSEDSTNPSAKAYLLEIDTLREKISRVVPVGKSATDLAVHLDDECIYVTNWAGGSLLALDLDSLALVKTFTMTPFAGTGYSRSDAYRISAGGPGRLVIEAADQWIDINLFDTELGTSLGKSFQREGDGAYAPDQRHYFHGDSNISNASLHKFDTTGDKFTELKSVRPSGSSYYGSRTVLVPESGDIVCWNGTVFDHDLNILFTPGTDIHAVSADGRYVFTESKIYDTTTQSLIGSMPVTTTMSVQNGLTGRLVTAKEGQLAFHILPGIQAPGRDRDPVDGSTILPRDTLSWAALTGATGYHVYLGTSATAVASATSSSPLYLGFFSSSALTLPAPLAAGQTYHWRVDIAAAGELIPGPVQSFQVANLIPSAYRIDAATVRGHDNLARDIALSSLTPAAGWQAVASKPWIRLASASGVTPAPLRLSLDASALPAGIHEGSVTLTGDSETIVIPVRLQVDPLQITRFTSRPGSTKVYALSGAWPTAYETGGNAYVLEIDTLREKITRVSPAGRGATDLAVHEADGRIYVTNWREGRILGLDLASFTLARTYETTPFAGVGYSSGDSYTVSAGGPGRLIFEAADQWISVTLFDTVKGVKIATSSQRQGDGAYAPDLRHYYHGDSNSSGATLHKLDTTGDTFAQLKEVRAVGLSYYGSRTVLVSEDGSRVSWNGVVFDADLNVLFTPGPEIYALSADGRYAFTETSIYDTATQRVTGPMPVATSTFAHNALTGTLVTAKDGQLAFHHLTSVNNPGRDRDPVDGSTILPRDTLSWAALAGATGYHVYLGDSAEALASATAASTEYLGLFSSATVTLDTPLVVGRTYFWRIDILIDGEIVSGQVQSFQVASLIPALYRLDAATVHGHDDLASEITFSGADPTMPWSAIAGASWIHVLNPNGTVAQPLQLSLDASSLEPGLHQSSVTLVGGGTTTTIPVRLQVDPLALTVLRSDPASDRVYAVSEFTPAGSSSAPRAYLLEIDTTLARIARVVPAGTGVSDLALHAGDHRLYVTNWTVGRLLAFDRTSLQLVDTYTNFSPSSAYENDAYRISAGGPGRLIIEEEDQWIDISLFDTTTGTTLSKAFTREGGGAYDPTGRYYYHGDNNISDASLHQFDTTGDTWLKLADIRVSSISYYGSRTVIISEDGSRVFWNGSVFTTSPFSEEWTIRSEIIAATADGLVAFSRNLVFDVATRASVMAMPGISSIVAYNSTSDKLVTQSGTRLACHPVGYIQPLPAPALTVHQARDRQVQLAIRSDNLRAKLEIQRRLPGQPAWTNVSSPTLRYESTETITGLSSETTYEFRARAVGPFSDSDWSETLTVTTLLSPPDLGLPPRITLAENSPLSLNLPIDRDWTYAVTDLPGGITFDPATGLLSGTPAHPGRYTFTVAASNEGGTTTVSVDLLVTSADALATTARYTGLISSDDGIAGCWVLNRIGARFTGTLRTNIGTSAFSGLFVSSGEILVASANVRLVRGVSSSVSIQRDVITDRITLGLSIYPYSAATLDDTGYASPWHATRRPYPGDANYTALFAPVSLSGDATQSSQPGGRGFARITAGRNGTLTVTGENALGQRFTGSHYVQLQHLAPLFASNASGALWGALGLQSPDRPGPDLEGILGWAHYDNTRSKLYPEGFYRSLRIVGSRFAKMPDFASFTAGSLHFGIDGGDFAAATGFDPFTETITATPRALSLPKTASSPTGSRLASLSYSRQTGMITGTVNLVAAPGANGKKRTQKVAFRGLAIQDIDGESTFFGGGYVLVNGLDGRKRSGWMTLTEPETDYVPEVTEAYYDDTISDPGSFNSSGLGSSGTGSTTGSSSSSSGSYSGSSSDLSMDISILEVTLSPIN
jgi:hypothetical protein